MQKKPVRVIIISFALALMLGACSYLRLGERYELVLLDLRFKARPIQNVNPQIVIVEIGNDTLANLGQWPLSRDYHATLIKILSAYGVKAIVFDVLFSEAQEEDALLAEATKQVGCVYYPYALQLKENKNGLWQSERIDTKLLPSLAEVAKGTGHANILADVDGKRRRIPLLINYQGSIIPQLTLKAAWDYLGIKDEEIKVVPGRFIQLGDFCRLPIDEEGACLVNLAGGWKETFQHYSYSDILVAYAQAMSGESLPGLLKQLKDKLCFVGLTATGTADLNPTALEPVYPMIGLHANLLNSVLSKNFLTRAPRLANLAILYLLCLLNLLLTGKTKPPMNILFCLGLLALFIGASFLLFLLTGVWIDLFLPITFYILLYLGLSLFRYLKELRQRELLEKELAIARNIQRSFLKELPAGLRGADIAVEMETARHVGGDLYDFVQLPDGRLGLCVGDVSGKGVPAALLMAQVISQFRHFAYLCTSCAETLTKLNRSMCREARSGLFVTMAYLLYDSPKGEITLASAGHLPPLIFRQSQLVEKIEVSEGIPLGLIEEADFAQIKVRLEKGEMVLLYTDGVTEARNAKGKEFGKTGILQALNGKLNLTSFQTVQLLKHSLNAFEAGAPQHDDITIMALKVT